MTVTMTESVPTGGWRGRVVTAMVTATALAVTARDPAGTLTVAVVQAARVRAARNFSSDVDGQDGASWLRQAVLQVSGMPSAGPQEDVSLGNSFVDMYAECGTFRDARYSFDQLPDRSVGTWKGMLAVCGQREPKLEALHLHSCMQMVCPSPNPVTFVCFLETLVPKSQADAPTN